MAPMSDSPIPWQMADGRSNATLPGNLTSVRATVSLSMNFAQKIFDGGDYPFDGIS
ncbi:hypothetical protein GJ744_006505 [Endocarpon pusillum]|uniref:Uncharacterized protein n=1 Tax=Endocarpon pusillum TaxID=364733 RepID=A0A8H7AVS7_9EURO|nr:hypothetical protein GJ744_006505 [Endocarpon pusillum]